MFRKSYGRRPVGRNISSGNLHESQLIKKATFNEDAEPYVAQTSFSQMPVNAKLKENIAAHGYDAPTQIQDATIPHVLEGRDLIGIANTGTGKTAAFLIPLIDRVTREPATKVLIILPTRELADQIKDELRSLARNMGIYSALCIGGSPMYTQIHDLMANPAFVIGTPGRLKDLAERRVLHLDRFSVVVLDEVDRMLDMGFIDDISSILSFIPKDRQSLFFSATLSPKINTLISTFSNNPVRISLKTQESSSNVDQGVVRLKNGQDKMGVLAKMLGMDEYKKVLIFGRTKIGVDRIFRNLFEKGFKVASIHGNKTQPKRNQAIRLFEQNVVNILVATDVASRGIDISDISHVINYDKPATYEDYVHRIGRTGRGNKKGIALTFVEYRN